MLSPALLLALSGVFVSVALLAGFATWTLVARQTPEQRRIRAIVGGGASGIVTEPAQRLTDTLDPALVRLSKLMPKKSAKDMSRLQKRLARAGYQQPEAPVYYTLAQLAMPVVLGFLVLGVLGPSWWMYALLAAVAGYTLPGFFIERQTKLRKKAIRNGLPDALDLLTVCVEAGSGLDQAIVKATDELDIAHPALAYEFRLIVTEIRAGKPRLEAFKNFAQRTGVEDVRALVAMLTQTDRFGTSIAQALRIHSETARLKRRQEAEERAAKVSVKLVFPLALCLFPALYIVCFGPVALKIYRAFGLGNP
jgi:tight adherence protein C